MRGEHASNIASTSPATGSSPHARGTHVEWWQEYTRHGIIPACAGNTGRNGGGDNAGWDHPRMRGEHCRPVAVHADDAGSSPHARGTPRNQLPASHRHVDHPRMRGEHSCRPADHPPWSGSSPHARGTHTGALVTSKCDGIIPACAGNTIVHTYHNAGGWDHPRMRGEHACQATSVSGTMGSSPHARGTLTTVGYGDIFPGIIPACAGNTLH